MTNVLVSRVISGPSFLLRMPSTESMSSKTEKELAVLEEEMTKAQSTKAYVFSRGSKDVYKTVQLLRKNGLKSDSLPEFGLFDADNYPHSNRIALELHRFIGRIVDFPIVFVRGNCVGGVKELEKLSEKGVLSEMLKSHDYDLIVIGGGSGGIAAAKKAADLSKKVVVLDFVKPTPLGTTWDLGGTCVNVGCIPKKLMHQAALLGNFLDDAPKFGWQLGTKKSANWKTLVDNVHTYILNLNQSYKGLLKDRKITYINGYGTFIGSHKIKAALKDGKETILTADKFLIAAGVRPRYLDCPGAKEYCITSDDLFTLPYSPGKTLIVGASYIALECAGFLHGMGFDVTVMVRSILLRGFDRDMAERVGKHMEEIGVKFIKQTVPTKIEKVPRPTSSSSASKSKRQWLKVIAKSDTSATPIVETYKTVLLAIGRDAVTDDMKLEEIGVQRNKTSKQILCYDNDQSVSLPYVYAVGDISFGKPELTPVAIQAGRYLMSRLFGGSTKLCDYVNVPTTVFTPLEYGCCGLSEEAANEKYPNRVAVYHNSFLPLELTLNKRKDADHCYAKLIFLKEDDNEHIIGLHVLGPNAGEITQGFSIGIKARATKEHFMDLIGIHPTCAESLTFANLVAKSSGGGNSPSSDGVC